MSETINKRIAKNTLFLYMRTIFVMVVSLFTSRVILNSLGIDDFGLYNVVGGIVSLFSVISSSLSMSISRFTTFALGQKNNSKLEQIFCTSVNILLLFSLFVVIIAEIVGGWFLNNTLNIPEERVVAANWVFQFTIISFVFNLLSVPYNALIIAHEKMSAFAYISILEVSLKLGIAYLIYVSPFDKLIVYGALLALVSFFVRITYMVYCKMKFKEAHYKIIFEKGLIKQMTSFAGWSFMSNIVWVMNTQGINFLINIFFGVAANAARGVSNQVEGAIKKFVTDFTTAINPQITKYYAIGELDSMYELMCRGSKITYFLLMLFALPIMFETPMVLKIWLNVVPDYTVVFFRLSIIGTMIDLLGNSKFIAFQATGKMKKYVLMETILACFIFPLTWLAFKLGASAEFSYIIFIFFYFLVFIARLLLSKKQYGLPCTMFLNKVVLKIVPTTLIAILPSIICLHLMSANLYRFFLDVTICLISSIISVYFVGLSKEERYSLIKNIKNKFNI